LKTVNISQYKKVTLLLIIDILIITLSISAAYSLRLEQLYPLWKIEYQIFIIFYLLFIPIFYFNNIYQILIRYFDNYSIIKIIKTTLIFQFVLILVNLFFYEHYFFPRSVSFIAPIFICILVLLSRIILNFLSKANDSSKNKLNNRILIYGINNSSVAMLNNIRKYRDYGRVIGLIDVRSEYKKREINGVKIFKLSNLINIINDNKISEIIIGPKSITVKNKIKLFELLENKNIRIITMNESDYYLPKLIQNNMKTSLNFFNIVNRPKIDIDNNFVSKSIKGKKIIVTGGGGSIGSELCIQLLNYKAKKIYVIENSEFNLFQLLEKIKLEKNYNKNIIIPVLTDCSDTEYLLKKFKNLGIDEIYHAAAYKHVSLGEENPYSIVKNNIFGTLSVINFAIKKNIKNFTFISSDKAVNPKSLLGLTKKFGESLVHHYFKSKNRDVNKSFTVVRFGNVVGSSGSVLPIFIRQIQKNMPLTVTHKKVERYFMSITEAVQLVIQSSHLSKGFNIFALDMGNQLNIYDIAKRVIRLSGNTLKDKANPSGDIEIKIIGLKKGEKLSEEVSLGKKLSKTKYEKIFKCDEDIIDENMQDNISKVYKILKSNKVTYEKIKQVVLD